MKRKYVVSSYYVEKTITAGDARDAAAVFYRRQSYMPNSVKVKATGEVVSEELWKPRS